MNQLFFGDNLDVLRQYIKDDSVDLVYLDPPFKSNQIIRSCLLSSIEPAQRPKSRHTCLGDSQRKTCLPASEKKC
jgi:16S rRNA G966 N2-methylase RsmD